MSSLSSDGTKIILSLVELFILIFSFAWREFFRVPTVTWHIESQFPISSSETLYSVAIENEGRAPARNVKITIKFAGGTITKHFIECPEDYSYDFTDNSSMQVRLKRLAPGIKMHVYIIIAECKETPKIFVIHDNGMGIEKKEQEEPGLIPWVILAIILIAFIILKMIESRI